MKLLFLIIFLGFQKYSCGRKSPHIIFILVDDLGWNDVSFHGSHEIQTPNIDALAFNGVILNNHYSETLCSPSRAALLTGKYPIHIGMQHNVVMETHPTGLPLSENLLPQYLKKSLGYRTHAVGKWHLGFYKKEFTPTYRGFDSFYGLWNGYHDYYTHNVQAWFVPFEGYDMRRNMAVDWSALGHYSTDLFTNEATNIIRKHNDTGAPLFLYLAYNAPHAATYEDPLQAPESEEKKFMYLKNPHRRRYAAMVSSLDASVAKVIEALRENYMLDDSIIVFVSDNGAPTVGLMKNYGSNWPLKGEKSTPWEGGIKTVAFMWSPLLNRTKRISNQLIHISDWLPTLFAAAGGDENELNHVDGTNMWDVLSGRRSEFTNYTILHNIDEESGFGYAALRDGPFKFVNGTSMLGYLDDWFGETQNYSLPPYDIDAVKRSKVNSIFSLAGLDEPLTRQKILTLRQAATISCEPTEEGKLFNTIENPCKPRNKPCLFNIFEDPCERRNLYGYVEMRDIQQRLETKINQFRKSKVDIVRTRPDRLSNPTLYNNTWTNWGDITVGAGLIEQPR